MATTYWQNKTSQTLILPTREGTTVTISQAGYVKDLSGTYYSASFGLTSVSNPGSVTYTYTYPADPIPDGVAGGSDTYVQFNDGGVLGGDSGLVYAKATKNLGVGGKVTSVSTAITGLTATRIPLVGTAGLIGDDEGVTHSGTGATKAVVIGGISVGGSGVPAVGTFLSAANAIGFSTNNTEHWMVNASGNLNPVGSKGIGTIAAPVSETVSAKFTLSALNTAPASAAAAGVAGEVRFCADALYVCIAENTWVKTVLATWA